MFNEMFYEYDNDNFERTHPSFPMGKLGTFSSFQVTHAFQGELYVIRLKCY